MMINYFNKFYFNKFMIIVDIFQDCPLMMKRTKYERIKEVTDKCLMTCH